MTIIICNFYIAPTLYDTLQRFTLKLLPVLGRVTQVLLDILAYYHWTMAVLLGDFHPSELERLDKPCGRAILELATIRS